MLHMSFKIHEIQIFPYNFKFFWVFVQVSLTLAAKG